MTIPSDTGTITQDDKLWALLSYLLSPIISIVVLLMDDKKSRPYIKFHAVQALIMTIIGYICYMILGWILIGFILGGAIFIYMIVIGIMAFNGNPPKVPVISDWIKKNNWA